MPLDLAPTSLLIVGRHDADLLSRLSARLLVQYASGQYAVIVTYYIGDDFSADSVDFDVIRYEGKLDTPTLLANAAGRSLNGRKFAWWHSDWYEQRVRDEPHPAVPSVWIYRRGSGRLPRLIHVYGALFDWMGEAARRLAPPSGPPLEYTVPTIDLPHVVQEPARLIADRRRVK